MTGLELHGLNITYRTATTDITAVNDLSLSVRDGEIFGIVGESGCGKSTLASGIVNLLDENGEVTAGEIEYGGRDIAKLSERELSNEVRGKQISMVFQNPDACLDPVFTAGQQIRETLITQLDLSKQKANQRAVELLEDVGIPSPKERLKDYPHEFSGGMKQRLVIAIALACEPGLLIADEPTTGLDVSIQAQIIDLLKKINKQNDTTIIIITHNLGVIAEICDRIGVMYAGNLVEVGENEQVLIDSKHPYTKDLLKSLPERHLRKEELAVIGGAPPDLGNPPDGCRYHPRCSAVCCERCESGPIPPNYEKGSTVRCYLYDPEIQEPEQ